MNTTDYLAKIEEIITGTTGAENMPETAPVVAMFLEDFRPADHTQPSGDNMTSLEIVTALEDTCRITTTDVALVMTWLGYRLHVNEYRGHEWAMTACAND